MTNLYDVCAIGHAIVDVIAPADDAFIERQGLTRGGMTLIEQDRADELTRAMAEAIETSGGSAANTIAGLASFGGKGAFIGKLADDRLGGVFEKDMTGIGATFSTGALLSDGTATGRCLINVTPDGQRTMATFLGAASRLAGEDVSKDVVEGSQVVYLEGYLFGAEEAFAKAAALAHGSGRLIALTLSDAFIIDIHRPALTKFIETQVDILFANELELTTLFQTDDFDQAVESVRRWVKIAAITRSEKGSVVISRDETHLVPAEPVDKVVDTTGAGDQYAAGFLHGFAQGKSLPTCGKLGSIAAAEVISHFGPRPQVSLKDLAAKAGLS
jgi:sugar/nucleoside kinase (ribokinase family)